MLQPGPIAPRIVAAAPGTVRRRSKIEGGLEPGHAAAEDRLSVRGFRHYSLSARLIENRAKAGK
jgi:hypothetical protein